jgi:primosomal protein N' (replication factor Y)
MTSARTVEVAVPRPVWGTFTYSVPPDLDGGTLSGCRVAVEFGGARVVGMVWSEGGVPRGDRILKPLLERLDPHPLPPSWVLQLLHWMAEYYFAPPGLCAACGFPPGMQGTAVRVLDVAMGAGLLELCRKPGIYRYDSLKASAPPGYPFEATLYADAAKGLALLLHRPETLPPQKFETVVEAGVKPDELVKAAQAIRGRAPRQADILVRIASTMEPVSRAWLLAECGAPRESLNRLVLQGLLLERKRAVSRDPLLGLPTEAHPAPSLTHDQRAAVEAVTSAGRGTFLLHGITGSGKTEVYLRVIEGVLTAGRQALVLVPEISLTPQLVNRFNSRFRGKVAVLHSGLSRGERLDAWNMVRRGLRPIVIGARSALFAPLPDLGVLVVDEEHDGSYKQGELPFYNARDMAVLLGSMISVPVILGSASPSMESFQNAAAGRYKLLALPDRVGGAALPKIRLIDTRDMENRLVTDALLSAIGKHTSRGGQVILLVNRRGHSPIQMCFHCGHTEKCPHCGIAMTYHKRGELLRCHHCSHWKAAGGPCPVCGAERFVRTGPGIQKVEEILAKQLPGTRVLRMDTDTTRGKSSHRRILDKFRQGGADVLLGTQMVAKGHDFPNVTLVGVVNAEMGLSLPDFRSAERVFSLLLQAAGRAGRGDSPGEVLIQTGCPDDPAISSACVHDYHGFARGELSMRKALALPPFTRMLRLLLLGPDSACVETAASRVGEAVASLAGIQLRGPCPAALPRIGDRFRWSILVTAAGYKVVANAVKRAHQAFSAENHGGVRMMVDVDPQDML